MLKDLVRNWRERKKGQLSEEDLLARLDRQRLPRHVAIIMDGNGRWARRRGMPRTFGHRAGMESIRDIVRLSTQLGIGYLTLYAFSTENWKRPTDEVNFLMNLLVEYLHKEIDELCQNNIRIHPIGLLDELPAKAGEALQVAVARSRHNSGLTLNLALNYGGRTELVEAVRAIAREVASGRLFPESIDEPVIAGYLYTAGQPDPDLLIRPAGDYRVSNFLLWQLAYTEFWMTPVMWPDFRKVHLLQALVDYQRRERRFGGLIKSQAGEN
ncbi:isoprenyl transferase [Desulfotomaculum copahuensis]|uniref:Isoprenyl transferase n=1 Tax=Desulfotomaculum copahuensis TaxID=1838280 RepID=A0A1B7LHU7_9FIRM|nr:isoprenyl transferase [Desulfotomaculum copahuensis]OAT85857.1 di-trans,poly-cis-decaprenylcistransferase [Desulfotomaculum copahuensis]